MSEAFVKTLKRDYIRISTLLDAETALRLFDDGSKTTTKSILVPRSRWLPL
jgi:hypothetical protein